MHAFLVEADNKPGALADIADAIAGRGINIAGIAATTAGGRGSAAIITNDQDAARLVLDDMGATYREVGLVSTALEDRPGTLASAARRLASAGVNIEIVMPTGMEAGKVTIAFGVDNVERARQAIGETASTPA